MDNFDKRFTDIKEKLNILDIKKRIEILEADSQKTDFWQDHISATVAMKELSELRQQLDDIELITLYLDDEDYKNADNLLTRLEKSAYFSSPHDKLSAIMSIHSGQGGTEAMDWVEMLFRMYTRFFEIRGYEFDVLDQTPGEEAGIKSITMNVNGRYAYGNLKFEAGVHRLVRQSPFNADKLRQTSFALVEVMPQIEDSNELDLKEEDLEWSFFRSGGHGGQNVNKVSTAVRLKHLPTNTVVTASSQRYQGQNREQALKLLSGILWSKKEDEKRKEEARLKGGYKTPGWGNQIRSYVLHPYQMVKDLRTHYETSDTQGVLNGQIGEFIDEELKILS